MTKDPGQFLRLQDVVFPAPLPALLSLLIIAGVAYLGWGLASRLRRGSPESAALRPHRSADQPAALRWRARSRTARRGLWGQYDRDRWQPARR
jgi:threonine/homoserine/homoserine lactone efflux protein